MHQVGVDILEIARIERAVSRWGDSFLKRIYTDRELSLYHRKPPSLAARFAGKEAVIKAFGAKRDIYWKEIEILADSSGKPMVQLYNKAQERARSLGLKNIAISLSHSKDYAIAFVTIDSG